MLKNSARFLLTDVLPFELPIIFSNKDFSKYVSKKLDEISFPDFEKILKDYSVPFEYKIIKDDHNYRTISLMNPLAQIQAAYFIDKYDHDIIHYLELYGKHSLRKPSKISPIILPVKQREKEIEKYKVLSDIYKIDISNDDLDESPYFESYFINKNFNRIHEFESPHNIMNLERRYKYAFKTDIENCFNSIYTHSISWAYLEDKDMAKKRKKAKTFDNDFDRLMQKSNYDETNGILVGSNLSRIFAEIILSKIDTNILNGIKKITNKHNQTLKEGRDFNYYRYIDDIYIFFNCETLEKEFKDIINEKLDFYNLRLNESKTFTEQRPFYFRKKWISEAFDIISEIGAYADSLLEEDNKIKINNEKIKYKIRSIIKENSKDKIRISNYFLSSLLRILTKFFKTILTNENLELEKDKHIIDNVKLIKMIMNLSVYIVSLNISYVNIKHLFQIKSLIFNNIIKKNISNSLEKSFMYSLNDIESIIESNSDNSEITNLIILLTMLDYKINSKTINKILHTIKQNKNTEDLFILVSLAFQQLKYNNKENTNLINIIIKDMIEKYKNSNYFNALDKNSKENGTLTSSYFYYFNAFYYYPLISENIKKELHNLMKLPSPHSNDILNINKDYNGCFINWYQTIEDSIKELLLTAKYTNVYE